MKVNLSAAGPLDKSVIRGHVAALAIMVTLSVAMTYPLAFRAWDTITNYGDPLLNTWIIAWDVHKLGSDPLNLFNANIFHPYTNTLAYSENLIGTAIIAAPLIVLTDNPVFAYNVIVLASFILSGLGAYLLAYRLTGSWYAGLMAGLIFAFSPFRFGQFSHIQLLTIQWLPFTFLSLIQLLDKRTLRYALLFALFTTLQCLSCVYYTFYIGIAVGLYLVYRVLLHWSERRPVDWVLLRRLAGALIVVMVVVGPVLLPYSTARMVVGERELEQQGGAAIENYLTMPRESLLGRIPPFNAHGVPVEETYFPGLVVLALLALFLATRQWRQPDHVEGKRTPMRREPLFFLLLGAIAFVLSLGPDLRLTVDGKSVLSPLPYAFLYEWLPGFKAMRVPARFAILTVFAWSILAAYAAAKLAHQRKVILQVILPLALTIEYLSVPVPTRPIEVGAQVPEVYRWLGSLNNKGTILELPSTTSPWFWEDAESMGRLARQQYLSTYHWHSTVMGYSGFYPPLFWESVDRVLTFPSTEALSYLRGMGVQYVIVHSDEMGPELWASFQHRLALFTDQLTLVKVVDDAYAYALNKPVRTAAEPKLDFHLPSIVSGKHYYAYIQIKNPNQGSFVHLIPQPYTVTYHWEGADGTAAQGVIEGRLPLVNAEGTDSIPLIIPYPPVSAARLQVTLEGLDQVVTATQQVLRVDSPLEEALCPPQNGERRMIRANLNFDDQMQLSHVTLTADTYRAGDSLDLTLYWQKLAAQPGEDIIVFVKLLNPQRSTDVAQRNLPPGVRRGPASSWSMGETVIDRHLLQLPTDLPPGQYWLIAGLYDSRAKKNLSVISEDGTRQDRVFETRITIN